MTAEAEEFLDPARPMTDAEREIWQSVVDGGWALLAEVTARMTAEGLSVTDLRILEAISDQPRIGISELASSVHMGVSTVSRQIRRLVADDVLERIDSEVDGRHRHVRLTINGRRVLDDHVRTRDEVIRRHVIDVLSVEEYAALGTAFGKIADSVV